MRKKILIIISSLFLAVSTYTVSNAASLNVGVTGSLATIDASGSETDSADSGSEASVRNANVENPNVPIGSVFVEFESDFYGLTLGAEHVPASADVSDSIKRRTDLELSVTGTDTTTSNNRDFKANAEVENFNKVYLELPIMDMFFVRAGMAEIDVNTTEVASGNGGSYGNVSLDGLQLGVGMKGTLRDNVVWKTSYEQNDFSDLRLVSTGNASESGTNTIEADLDTWALKLSLGYQF